MCESLLFYHNRGCVEGICCKPSGAGDRRQVFHGADTFLLGPGNEPWRGHLRRRQTGRAGLAEPGQAGFDFVWVDLLEEARGLCKVSSPLLSVLVPTKLPGF